MWVQTGESLLLFYSVSTVSLTGLGVCFFFILCRFLIFPLQSTLHQPQCGISLCSSLTFSPAAAECHEQLWELQGQWQREDGAGQGLGSTKLQAPVERKNHITVVLVMPPSLQPAATAVWEAQLAQELGETPAPCCCIPAKSVWAPGEGWWG